MSKGNVTFSSNNNYFTPNYIIDYFGKFDYDPATTKEQAVYLNIKNYDTIETNGLIKEWNYQKIWINPPFTKKFEFLQKAYETYNKYKNDIYILLPIESLTSVTFHNIAKQTGGKIYLPKRRINFISFIGASEKMPAFGSVIIKIQDKWEVELVDFRR